MGRGPKLIRVLSVLGLMLTYARPRLAAVTPSSASRDAPAAVASDPFRFSTHSFSHYFPTLFGNGFLFCATPWNGTSASASTLAGLYDHLEQKAYAYEALIPAWNEVDYWNGSHWLDHVSPQALEMQGYLQTLDTRRGVLSTRYDWVDSNHRTRVETEEFASRERPQVGVVRVRLTPNYGVEVGPVTVTFPLGGGPDSPFIWEGAQLPGPIPIRDAQADSDSRGFVAHSATRDGQIQVAQAVRLTLSSNLPPLHQLNIGFDSDPARPALNVKFIVRKGETYAFTKFVVVHSSLESKSPAADARAVANEAERAGFEGLLRQQEAAWQKLWRTDILIRGDAEAQRVIHAAMFYLYSALRPDTEWSVPAMALPSRAYLGRIWWDADTWILPAVLVLQPELARSIVAYRCRRLAAAEQNAQSRGCRGALYPMESGGTGQEEAPEWSSEIHVTGDVAMAQWRYYQATGDSDWLRACGAPVLRAVADFWMSRVAYDPHEGHYGIHSVTGPNEAITNVDNDSYTNALARSTLEAATEAAHVLGETADPEWSRVSQKLFIPFDAKRATHSEHSGDQEGKYAHALILLTYPLGMRFSDPIKRNDLDVCLRNFGRPGYEVGMLGNFYSIVASELKDRTLANKLFLSMMRSYAQPPFYAMTETPSNHRAVFLTAEGAFLQQVIFGFSGLRLTNEGLKAEYPPLLPPTWQSLELRRIKVRGKIHDVQVTAANKLRMTLVTE